jgi:DNA-binding transcriptional MerR regulator
VTERTAGTYTVGEVAELSGVSVRTLHHYHEIGLLAPTVRSPAGYRLYSPEDLRRLRQILLYRELDFRLEEIADMLASPDSGTDDHLRRQHALLRARQDRTARLIGAIAMDLAEAHRRHLSRWFYDCGYDAHRGLAELYVSDPRHMASYDEVEPGFSQYVHDAIMANAARHS